MNLKLLVLVLNFGLSVKAHEVSVSAAELNDVEFMSYGWEVTYETEEEIYNCPGVFVAPQIFISDISCVSRFNCEEGGNISVVKPYYNNENKMELVYVEVKNIILNKGSRVIDLNVPGIAIVETEPVDHNHARWEDVKLYSSIDEIDTTTCSLAVYDSVNITFINCDVLHFDNRYEKKSNIYCFDRDFIGLGGETLECYTKSQPISKRLVGIVSESSEGINSCGSSNFVLTTITNLIGLEEILKEHGLKI